MYYCYTEDSIKLANFFFPVKGQLIFLYALQTWWSFVAATQLSVSFKSAISRAKPAIRYVDERVWLMFPINFLFSKHASGRIWPAGCIAAFCLNGLLHLIVESKLLRVVFQFFLFSSHHQLTEEATEPQHMSLF